MGVTGLWKLIEPCGKPVPVDLLEGKILAIDISIWLHQVVKGFQDSKGSALNNAHLLGLFHRLCKLLYYRVKPVFIFDGCVPQIKRDTIARRIQQRNKLSNEAERIQSLLLQALAKEKVVQQALGANTELLLKSVNKKSTSSIKAKDDADDMFRLPVLPSSSNSKCAEEDKEDSYCSNENASFSTDTDSSFEESNKQHAYLNNLQSIDVRSEHFKSLPADVRHEILVDIKETRKQSSWGRLHELPAAGDEFSTFQMKRLLKRRAVQESLEEAEQEMGGRSLTFSELQNFFTEEGIVEPSKMEKGTKQICSDENTRILLVRDLKNKFKKGKELEKIENSNLDAHDAKHVELNQNLEKKPEINPNQCDSKTSKYLLNESDVDLELAIALSLEESQVYNEMDYAHEGLLKLNQEQRSQLKNAAVGPARNYMIEYGGMNDEEVDEIMNKTQLQTNPEEDEKYKDLFEKTNVEIELRPSLDNTEFPSLHVSDGDDTKSDIDDVPNTSLDNPNSQELNLYVSDKSETDSDLEIVSDNTNECDMKVGNKIEIVLDMNEQISLKDDLFADIFQESHQPTFKNEIDKQEAIVPSNLSEEFICETPTIKEEKSIFEKYRSPGKSRQIEETKQKPDILALLDELKTQINVVQHINLDDIKLNNGVIELSDDERNEDGLTDKQENIKSVNEIVEIYDSEDNLNTLKHVGSPKKSPKLTTPNKEKSIVEYFEPEYIVKRKSEQEKNESTPPQITSPFFANKTPKSKSKTENKEVIEKLKQNKSVATKLFNDKLESDDVFDEAASVLRESKSTKELESMAVDLAQKRQELENERNRQDRMGMTISQRMNLECQELLRLFGVPYIVAPMEAEAQCAFLDAAELTNGTITDDSDIWLFGGRTVYKNFFAQNKHVLEYRSEQIEKSFNCDRKKLIELACLVGSDYTPGVHGIGAVTALEIIASFTGCSKEQTVQNSNSTKLNILSSLCKFRDWWLAHKSTALPPGTTARMSLLKKLKNIELDDGFPSPAVVEAYLTPEVDNCKDPFSWGYPDVQSIREFAKRSFGWTNSKTDDILNPVLKKLNEKKTQSTIRNYFTTESVRSQNQLKLSKRLQNAIATMTGNIAEQDNISPPEPKKKRRTCSSRRKAKSTETTNTEQASTSKVLQADDLSHNEIATVPQQTAEIVTKNPRIPNSKQTIPQRERQLEKMNKNKEKAVEIMKKERK